ncbi:MULTISPECIES: hypothetical protein [Nocardia]|uniref:Uncharacterized protein n=2 Tax=Nocardia TaxID=1817 RepID=A0ABV3FM45_9NOCA|nr:MULTISPECIES: hypothetical protein [Nocardia]
MNDRAIGLLHLGVTDRLLDDQNMIEHLARDSGYQLVRILTIDHDTYMPVTLMISTAARSHATVIVAPDIDHLGVGYKAVPHACAVLLPTGMIPRTPRPAF